MTEQEFRQAVRAAAQMIGSADALIVSASNGLSITEGLNLFAHDAEFEAVLGDLAARYGFRSILEGMFYRWPTVAERDAFWDRLLERYVHHYEPSQAMRDLRALCGDTPTFVVTSNGEGHFQLSGFDPAAIFEVEGSWRTVETCGQAFVPDPAQQASFQAFVQAHASERLVVLELGVGWRNQLIKAPLMDLVARLPRAGYVTINKGEVYVPEGIADRSVGIDAGIAETLAAMRTVA